MGTNSRFYQERVKDREYCTTCILFLCVLVLFFVFFLVYSGTCNLFFFFLRNYFFLYKYVNIQMVVVICCCFRAHALAGSQILCEQTCTTVTKEDDARPKYSIQLHRVASEAVVLFFCSVFGRQDSTWIFAGKSTRGDDTEEFGE